MENNDLKMLKRYIKDFVTKYNITDMLIDIEEIEKETCAVGQEDDTYKKVFITLQY